MPPQESAVPTASSGPRPLIDWRGLEVRQATVPDRLSREIELLIVRGQLPQRHRLPPERELSSMLGVSRPTLREALRVLESKGLVNRSPGRGTVVAVSSVEAARILGHAAEEAAQQFRYVMDLRHVIEPGVAARAAQRATAGQVQRLSEIIASSSSDSTPGLQQSLSADVEFHEALASLTCNPLLVDLFASLRSHLTTSRSIGLQSERRQQMSLAAHRSILDAITRHDRVAAEQAMADHLDEIEALVGPELGHGRTSPPEPPR